MNKKNNETTENNNLISKDVIEKLEKFYNSYTKSYTTTQLPNTTSTASWTTLNNPLLSGQSTPTWTTTDVNNNISKEISATEILFTFDKEEILNKLEKLDHSDLEVFIKHLDNLKLEISKMMIIKL